MQTHESRHSATPPLASTDLDAGTTASPAGPAGSVPEARKKSMSPRQLVQRFLVPQFVTSLIYLAKYRAVVSFKSEVELSPLLRLGKGSVISSFCKFKATDAPLSVGRDTGFAIGCFVSAQGKGIEIGDHCVFGPNVSITSSNYRSDLNGTPYKHQGSTSKGVAIGHNVWVGSNVTILDGSVLGDNVIVVANSLVNRRFPADCIVQGTPAKIIMKRTREGSADAR